MGAKRRYQVQARLSALDTPIEIPAGAVLVTRGELERLHENAERAYAWMREDRARLRITAKVNTGMTKRLEAMMVIERKIAVVEAVPDDERLKRYALAMLRDLIVELEMNDRHWPYTL